MIFKFSAKSLFKKKSPHLLALYSLMELNDLKKITDIMMYLWKYAINTQTYLCELITPKWCSAQRKPDHLEWLHSTWCRVYHQVFTLHQAVSPHHRVSAAPACGAGNTLSLWSNSDRSVPNCSVLSGQYSHCCGVRKTARLNLMMYGNGVWKPVIRITNVVLCRT